MSNVANFDTYNDSICFVFGLIYIPYTILFFYLFYEHHQRRKYPQNVIMLLLALGAVFRTVWLFGFSQYLSTMLFLIINRVAILLQFTALTILILMWLRALQITKIVSTKGNHVEPISALSFNSNQSANAIPIERETAQIYQYKQVEMIYMRYARFSAAFTVIIWIVLLVSLAGDDADSNRRFYNANVIMISSICLLQAVFTLVVGIRTALVLQKELTPVFLSSHGDIINNNNRNYSQDSDSPYSLYSWYSCRHCFHQCVDSCGLQSLIDLYRLFFYRTESALGLQLQRDVLRSLLTVSFVTFVFFFLRALGFLLNYISVSSYSPATATFAGILWPSFIFILPEFVPNLAIAAGISPPQGVLRLFLRRLCCAASVSVYATSVVQSSQVSSEREGDRDRERDRERGRKRMGTLQRERDTDRERRRESSQSQTTSTVTSGTTQKERDRETESGSEVSNPLSLRLPLMTETEREEAEEEDKDTERDTERDLERNGLTPPRIRDSIRRERETETGTERETVGERQRETEGDDRAFSIFGPLSISERGSSTIAGPSLASSLGLSDRERRGSSLSILSGDRDRDRENTSTSSSLSLSQSLSAALRLSPSRRNTSTTTTNNNNTTTNTIRSHKQRVLSSSMPSSSMVSESNSANTEREAERDRERERELLTAVRGERQTETEREEVRGSASDTSEERSGQRGGSRHRDRESSSVDNNWVMRHRQASAEYYDEYYHELLYRLSSFAPPNDDSEDTDSDRGRDRERDRGDVEAQTEGSTERERGRETPQGVSMSKSWLSKLLS